MDDAFELGGQALVHGLRRDALAEQWVVRDGKTGACSHMLRLTPPVVMDDASRRAFVEHFEAVRAIDHPGIVRVLDVQRDGANVYARLELVEAVTLSELRDASGEPLPVEVALRFALDAASALEALHRNGVAHGDVSPGTLFVLAGGIAMLAPSGLGVATCRAEGMAPEARLAFKAPEQRAGGDPTPRADVYGLAATLRAMLSEGELEDALAAALAENPKDRPDDVQAFVHSLEKAAGVTASPRFEVASLVTRLAARDLAALRLELESVVGDASAPDEEPSATAAPAPVPEPAPEPEPEPVPEPVPELAAPEKPRIDDLAEDTQPSLARLSRIEAERVGRQRKLVGVVLVLCMALVGFGVVAQLSREDPRPEVPPAPAPPPPTQAAAEQVPPSEPEPPAAAPEALEPEPAPETEPEPRAARPVPRPRPAAPPPPAPEPPPPAPEPPPPAAAPAPPAETPASPKPRPDDGIPSGI